jgi:hypothetical protein
MERCLSSDALLLTGCALLALANFLIYWKDQRVYGENTSSGSPVATHLWKAAFWKGASCLVFPCAELAPTPIPIHSLGGDPCQAITRHSEASRSYRWNSTSAACDNFCFPSSHRFMSIFNNCLETLLCISGIHAQVLCIRLFSNHVWEGRSTQGSLQGWPVVCFAKSIWYIWKKK